DCVHCRGDNARQTPFALAQLLLNLHALSDVYARADVAEKVAAGRESRDAMIQYPAVLAVIAPQTILHLKWLPRLEGRGVDFQAAVVILRVNTFRPSIAQFFFHRASSEVEPWFVEESAEFVLTGSPDHNRRRVRQNTEPLFTIAEFLFGPLARGDVFDKRDKVVRRTILPARQGTSQVDPHDGAVLEIVALLHHVILDLARQQPPRLVPIRLQVVWMGDVVEGLRHRLLAGVADDVAETLIDLQPAAVRSDAGNADGGVLEDGTEPRLAIKDCLNALLNLARALLLVVKPL